MLNLEWLSERQITTIVCVNVQHVVKNRVISCVALHHIMAKFVDFVCDSSTRDEFYDDVLQNVSDCNVIMTRVVRSYTRSSWGITFGCVQIMCLDRSGRVHAFWSKTGPYRPFESISSAGIDSGGTQLCFDKVWADFMTWRYSEKWCTFWMCPKMCVMFRFWFLCVHVFRALELVD